MLEGRCETSASPMKPDRGRIGRDAEHDPDLGRCQLLPGGEREDLPISLAQACEGGGQLTGHASLDRRAAPRIRRKKFDGLHPTPLSAPSIGQQSTGHAEQPGTLSPGRNVIKPTPCHDERIGYDILGARVSTTPPNEGHQLGVVRGEERLEAPACIGLFHGLADETPLPRHRFRGRWQSPAFHGVEIRTFMQCAQHRNRSAIESPLDHRNSGL